MHYSLSYRLGGFSPGLDPDAKAYINAVVSDGATVSDDQKEAINTFYKTGKSEGWYSKIKRLYLPIWDIEAANANCMVSATSGSFSDSGVTHELGYVKGDGEAGSFLVDSSGALGDSGVSNGNAHLMVLVYVAETAGGSSKQNGVADSGTGRTQIQVNTSGFIGYLPNSTTTATNLETTARGIVLLTSSSTSLRQLHVRNASAMDTVDNTSSVATALPNVRPAFMARNTNGTINNWNNAGYGAFGYGLDLNASQYTLALKNLWEDCTSLSLP